MANLSVALKWASKNNKTFGGTIYLAVDSTYS